MTPTGETWLPIPGWEGFYEVSDLGRVRSVDRVIVRNTGSPQTWRGRILFQGSHAYDGRHSVSLYAEGRRETHRVAPLVLQAFVGPRPEGMFCCHRNGDCTNDRLSNLRWDTPSGNELDKRRHGTHYLVNRTHCPQRHPLAEPNLVASALRLGYRNCLVCNRARSRKRTVLNAGLTFDLKAEADVFFAEIMKEHSRDSANDRPHAC